MASPTEMMDYPQAAQYLAMKLGTLYALVARKRIPHYRFSGRMVRFKRSELDRWLRERLVPPEDPRELP